VLIIYVTVSLAFLYKGTVPEPRFF